MTNFILTVFALVISALALCKAERERERYGWGDDVAYMPWLCISVLFGLLVAWMLACGCEARACDKDSWRVEIVAPSQDGER